MPHIAIPLFTVSPSPSWNDVMYVSYTLSFGHPLTKYATALYKCSSTFRAACSSPTTPLLDTTTLSFVYPPHGTPIYTYASPTSPILPAHVCDACCTQIHGNPSPRSLSSPTYSSMLVTLPARRRPAFSLTLSPPLLT